MTLAPQPYVQRIAQLVEIPNADKVINNESNTSNSYPILEDKDDKDIIEEFQRMDNDELIQEAEKLLKPFAGSFLINFIYSIISRLSILQNKTRNTAQRTKSGIYGE